MFAVYPVSGSSHFPYPGWRKKNARASLCSSLFESECSRSPTRSPRTSVLLSARAEPPESSGSGCVHLRQKKKKKKKNEIQTYIYILQMLSLIGAMARKKEIVIGFFGEVPKRLPIHVTPAFFFSFTFFFFFSLLAWHSRSCTAWIKTQITISQPLSRSFSWLDL